MKLFLASYAYFVWDIIAKDVNLHWKKVWCIRNAAADRWGKSARWNIWDIEFFDSHWAVLIDIDISQAWLDLDAVLSDIDILFVGWWNTRDLAELFLPYKDLLCRYIQDWLIYIWTSAGAMVVCTQAFYPVMWKVSSGLGLCDISIVPHRWSLWFRENEDNGVLLMSAQWTSSIMLTDIDMICIDWDSMKIKRSQKYTLEDIEKKVAESSIV